MSVEADRIVMGAKLKEMREYRGFSQEDVAVFLGVPRSAVSLIEKGTRRIDVMELRKMSKLFQCSIEHLTASLSSELPTKTIGMVARAAEELSPEDREEVIRFAQFLKSKNSSSQNE